MKPDRPDSNIKEYIFNSVQQEDIFAYYLGISTLDIQYCCRTKANKICNPLRNDTNPSLGFIFTGTKLYMKDFADSSYNGDCFYLVGILHGLDCNKKADFIKICDIILHNVVYNERRDYGKIESNMLLHTSHFSKRIINIHIREWSITDSNYWGRYGLNKHDLLRSKVYPIDKFWISNDSNELVAYPISETCYAYYLGTDNDRQLIKLYFPDRKRKGKYKRFITNNSERLECVYELRNAENLIVAKSRKDAIVLKKLLECNPYNNLDVAIISLSGEDIKLSDVEINALRGLGTNTYMFTDNDEVGIRCMQYHKQFGFKPIFIPRHYKVKDISDYVRKFGFNKTGYDIKQYINNLKQ